MRRHSEYTSDLTALQLHLSLIKYLFNANIHPPFCLNKPRTSLRKKQKQRAGLANLFDDTSQPAKR